MRFGVGCFEGHTFDGEDFRNQAIIGVTFKRCSFRRASFSGADLSYSIFEECDFYEADLKGACLYTARLHDCDLTKADFSGALLNGIRVKDANVTHSIFGVELVTGRNRKRSTQYEEPEGYWVCETFDSLPLISNLEADFRGLACRTTKISISFVEEQTSQRWRVHRRKSEVAKTIELLLVDNGYTNISDDYAYLFRYHQSRSGRRIFSRVLGITFRELISGYGVRLKNPILSWIFMVVVFAALYPAVPLLFPGSGLELSKGSLLYYGDTPKSVVGGLLEGIDYSLKVSSLSMYDNPKAIGAARFFSIFQTISSVGLVGVGLSVISRRSGVH